MNAESLYLCAFAVFGMILALYIFLDRPMQFIALITNYFLDCLLASAHFGELYVFSISYAILIHLG
jgi:hypothetical protein